MSYQVSELADYLTANGMACVPEGATDLRIVGVATLEDAGPDEISFLANSKYEKALKTTSAGAVIVSREQKVPEGLTVLRTADAYAAVAVLMAHIHGFRKHPGQGIHRASVIDPSARIGDGANIHHGVTVAADVTLGRDAVIYPGCYIARGCRLGDACTLYPNVVIYDGCIIGNRVTIHAGTIIGEDGLGYAPVEGKWCKIPQCGIVEIGDDVEIGSNCSIDRAALGRTVIGSGTKFSNLIAIGHGTRIGEDCMFVAQVGLAGSITVGRHVTLAGKVGIAGHLSIGDDVKVAAMSGIMRDVPPKTRMFGLPATEMREASKSAALVMRLPAMRRQIKKLEAQVAELREALCDRSSP